MADHLPPTDKPVITSAPDNVQLPFMGYPAGSTPPREGVPEPSPVGPGQLDFTGDIYKSVMSPTNSNSQPKDLPGPAKTIGGGGQVGQGAEGVAGHADGGLSGGAGPSMGADGAWHGTPGNDVSLPTDTQPPIAGSQLPLSFESQFPTPTPEVVVPSPIPEPPPSTQPLLQPTPEVISSPILPQ